MPNDPTTPSAARTSPDLESLPLNGEPVVRVCREPAADVDLVLGPAEDLVVGGEDLDRTGR